MTPLSQLRPGDHGPLRTRFEGDPNLPSTLWLGLAITTVFLTGLSLIWHGLR